MADIIIIDTSVFLNVLDVPGFNQRRGDVLDELDVLIVAGAVLLLPIAAIVETGNHIAHLSSGNDRRRFASRFCEQVKAAIAGEAPWQAMRAPDVESIKGWLAEFADHAMREVGMGDLSIIKDWEETCERHHAWRVRVWSLDGDLAYCDREARI